MEDIYIREGSLDTNNGPPRIQDTIKPPPNNDDICTVVPNVGGDGTQLLHPP